MSAPPDPYADRTYAARATSDGAQWSNEDIRDHELERARHALAYLKAKIGNDAMREVLRGDLEHMRAQVRAWVEASGGRWQRGDVELSVPGPGAQAFLDWYTRAMSQDREQALRAGHPEHFVSHPTPGRIEVIENIGETEWPWQIFYEPLPSGETFPVPWLAEYPVRFGSQIVDARGLRVAYTMHQGRDTADGLHLLMTTFLPAAAPPQLVQRHLRHFGIEFRNWTRFAWAEQRGEPVS